MIIGFPIHESRSTNQGFTLLEILIAILILTVGIAAIMWAISSGIYVTSDVENTDLALNIAQAKMEWLKNTAFASLADSGPTADTNFPRFSTTVNVAEGQNPMQVDVTVSWQVKGGQTSIGLTTLVANY
jgi:prepilin-type N-terminal cleavage/methylation domain-containing protein